MHEPYEFQKFTIFPKTSHYTLQIWDVSYPNSLHSIQNVSHVILIGARSSKVSGGQMGEKELF